MQGPIDALASLTEAQVCRLNLLVLDRAPDPFGEDFSRQRPLPSMLMLIPSSFSCTVKASRPRGELELKISCFSFLERTSKGASMQKDRFRA
jgi:hypothetical protein